MARMKREEPRPRTGRPGRRGKQEEPEVKKSLDLGPNAPHFIDAGIFLVLMIVGAIVLYMAIPVVFGEESTGEAQNMAELTTTTNQVLLTSTIPECVYIDKLERSTQYHDENVKYLLCEDMYIRTEGKQQLSVGNLQNGVEKSIGELGSGLLLDGFGLAFVVRSGEEEFVIVQHDQTILGLSTSNKVLNSILGTKNDNAYHVESPCYLRNVEEATITFALFKTSAFDMNALQGGG
jgi:hypothetical protein